jgi:histidinol-phosphate aminotransferase
MRVGFALARREVLAEVEPYRPPGSVAVPSVAVVTAALRDPDILAANLGRVARERARLADGLARLGHPPCPSVTNFLLVDLGGPEQAAAVAQGLLGRGLVPRTFGSDHPLAGHLRFTIRDEAQDELLLAALADLLPRVAVAGTPAPQQSAPLEDLAP